MVFARNLFLYSSNLEVRALELFVVMRCILLRRLSYLGLTSSIVLHLVCRAVGWLGWDDTLKQ